MSFIDKLNPERKAPSFLQKMKQLAVEGKDLNDYLMDHTKTKQEEKKFFWEMKDAVNTDSENYYQWFQSGYGPTKCGENMMIELAKDNPKLRSIIYDTMSRIWEGFPSWNPDDAVNPYFSSQAEVKALLCARSAAFWATSEDKKDYMDRFNLLKKKWDRHFPEFSKSHITIREGKWHEIDNFSILSGKSKYASSISLPPETAEGLRSEFLQQTAQKGYYCAQNILALDYMYAGDFNKANKMLDMMKNNKIVVDGRSGLEGYEETLDTMRMLQQEKDQSKLHNPTLRDFLRQHEQTDNPLIKQKKLEKSL